MASGGDGSRKNSQTLEKDSDVIDAGLGLAALFVVIVLAIRSGGFHSFTPWFVWPAAVFFVLGLSRRVGADENVWRRVGMLSVAWLFVTPLPFLVKPWWLGALVILVPPMPAAAGLCVRRLIGARRK